MGVLSAHARRRATVDWTGLTCALAWTRFFFVRPRAIFARSLFVPGPRRAQYAIVCGQVIPPPGHICRTGEHDRRSRPSLAATDNRGGPARTAGFRSLHDPPSFAGRSFFFIRHRPHVVFCVIRPVWDTRSSAGRFRAVRHFLALRAPRGDRPNTTALAGFKRIVDANGVFFFLSV